MVKKGKIVSFVLPRCGHQCPDYSTHHYTGGEYADYCRKTGKTIVGYEMFNNRFPDWCPLEDEGAEE